LVFQSTADLTNGDVSAAPQVFEYDANREELIRVSVGEAGYVAGMESADANGASITPQFGAYSHEVLVAAATVRLAVSGDGSRVVFDSAGGLTEAAKAAGEAGLESVYEYRSSGVISNGGVFSVSNGNGSFRAAAIGMDPAGSDVMFVTAAPVLASDVDTQEDLYDARSGGGFPMVPEVRDCGQSASCQGAAAGAPMLGGVATASAPGGGNLSIASGASSTPSPPRASPRQRLARALAKCRRSHRPGPRRRVCERSARRRLSVVKAKGKG
jgi:hypothetical protein